MVYSSILITETGFHPVCLTDLVQHAARYRNLRQVTILAVVMLLDSGLSVCVCGITVSIACLWANSAVHDIVHSEGEKK
jgi:hypothetical protein